MIGCEHSFPLVCPTCEEKDNIQKLKEAVGIGIRHSGRLTLYDIFEKVKMENVKSKAKHGMWSEIDVTDQWSAIDEERDEAYEAYCFETEGDHSEIPELIQLINVCCRRIMFITGDPHA